VIEDLQSLVSRLPRYGRRPAVGLRGSYGVRWWSYVDLHRRAYGFAGLLREWQVGRGDRMLLWAPNSPEWVGAALGAMLRGVVVVPVDEGASPGYVRRLVDVVQPALLLHGRDRDATGLDMRCALLTEGLCQRADPTRDVGEPGEPHDPAFILYTSGTTGEPRGVILTHANLASQVNVFRGWHRLTSRWPFRLMALSPLSHSQGLLIGLTVPLALGLSVIYSESVEPAHVVRTLRDCRVNLLLAVPGVQRLLADRLRATRPPRQDRTLAERIRPIRWFPLRRHLLFLATRAQLGYSFSVLLVGGGPLPAEDERFWYESGYVVVQGYGLTETSALVSVKVNGPFFARLGSIGKALPNQEVRLGSDGEVLVRGPNVSPGLFGEARDDAADGFLRTGDLAWSDRRDRLYFRGRTDNVIVTSEGANVQAEEVEVVLRSVPQVRDAVVTRQWTRSRVEVHATLLLADRAAVDAVIREANRRLEPHQRVHNWSVWPDPDFPRTSLLKARRAEVAAALSPPEPTPAANREPSLDDVRAVGDRRQRLDLLARHIVRGAPEAGPTPSLIEDLGLSSLDAVELVALIERYHHRPLSGLTVTPQTSLADLRARIRDSGPGRARSPLPVRQPRWSAGVSGRLLRRISRPALVGLWAGVSARIRVEWAPEAAELSGPYLLAVAPHRHWLDSFAVQAALPPGSRTLTVTNRDFAEYFTPRANTPCRTRLAVGLAYHVLWPLVFGFVILPNFGSTREGLNELGRLIDRGISPITFPKGLAPPGEPNPRHEPGIALMAIQTGRTILPVWLAGNDRLRVWAPHDPSRVLVRVGTPIEASPESSTDEVVARIEAEFERLSTVRDDGPHAPESVSR
jgi:long-chain acyl-CoA synthetase